MLGTEFELRLRDFFLHYDADRLLEIGTMVNSLSQSVIIEMIKADYNYDLGPASDGSTSGDAASPEPEEKVETFTAVHSDLPPFVGDDEYDDAVDDGLS